MDLNINSKALLNNGTEIPRIGLGTYQMAGKKEVVTAVNYALQAGYRHIDTAEMYSNEEYIGEAIKQSDFKREDIFITTKLWNDNHGFDNALKAFDESLNKLDLEYIDLYLIHWPVDGKRLETWKALEKLYRDGRCKAIGVCNYTKNHLEELINNSDTLPVINQVEFNPFVYQNKLLNYCKEKNIQVEGYTPLSRGIKFNNSTVQQIAERCSKTPAQVMLRWNLQKGTVIIPKSSHKERIEENINIFDFSLTDEEIERLDKLDENYRLAPDPHNLD